MEGVLHTTLLTSTLFLSSLLPQATSSASISPLPTIGQESFRVVKKGDTLKKIAHEVYDSEDFFTFILEDNKWIENPDLIEVGMQIKIRKNPFLEEVDPTVKLVPNPASVAFVPKITPQVQAYTAFATYPATPSAQPTVATISSPLASELKPTSNYGGGPLNEEQISYLGSCEAGMDPAKNTGNGFYGAFQFSYGTWQNMGTGYERADLAPLEVQKDAVQRLLTRSSIFTQFPGCSRKMQSLGLI